MNINWYSDNTNGSVQITHKEDNKYNVDDKTFWSSIGIHARREERSISALNLPYFATSTCLDSNVLRSRMFK